MTAKKLNRRQARWSLLLAQFDFVMHHRPSKSMGRWTLFPVGPITEQVWKTTTHGPPYSKFLRGPSIGRFRGSRRGTRNPEGHPKGDTRWREGGTSGESSEGVTRFISLLCEISGVVPIRWTSVFPRQDLFRTPPISVIVSLRFLMTLGWLVTVEDGRHWN